MHAVMYLRPNTMQENTFHSIQYNYDSERIMFLLTNTSDHEDKLIDLNIYISFL